MTDQTVRRQTVQTKLNIERAGAGPAHACPIMYIGMYETLFQGVASSATVLSFQVSLHTNRLL